MTSTRLIGALLVGACLMSAGCIGGGTTLTAAGTTSREAGWMQRLFRREPAVAPPSSAALTEVPDKLRNPSQLSLAYARLMTEAGNLPEAETHFNRVLADSPEHLEALLGLAKVQQLSGRLDLAEQTYHRALRSNPKSAAALHGLGQTYAARKRWDEAAELLNQAVLAAPNDAALRYDLAVALAEAGNIPAALPHFISTVGDAEAHYNIGLILHRQGRLTESEQHFRIALAKRPDLQQAQYWLDAIQREQHRPSPRAVTAHAAPTGPIQPVSFEREAEDHSVAPTGGGAGGGRADDPFVR